METYGDPISGVDIWVIDNGGQPVWHDTTNVYGELSMRSKSPKGIILSKPPRPGYVTQLQGPINVLTCDPAFVDFVLEAEGCDITPDPDAIIEDEPICYDDYVDIYNGACPSGIWDTIPTNCTFFRDIRAATIIWHYYARSRIGWNSTSIIDRVCR